MNRETPVEPPLRLALFSGNYNYIMDGPARALNRLVGYLEARNIPVLVFAPTARKAALEHNGTLVSVPSVSIPLRSEYRLGMGLTPHALAELKAFRPTLFHLAAPDLLGHSAMRRAKQWKLPVVSSFHTRFDTYARYYRVGVLEKYVTRYLRNFYNQCDQVYAPSESMAEELRRELPNADLRIWSRGVDCERFNPARRDLSWRRSIGFADEDVVISFAGRLVLEKGLAFFAETINLLEARGLAHKVLIAGDGPERSHLQNRLPKAHFTGYLSDAPLARAYASSDIFFNPSISESFGNTTLEAMASGLACVCAQATGSRSLVQDQKTGFLAPGGNHLAFADHLDVLIKSAKLRHDFGAAAVDVARQFDWDTILGGLVDNYHDALASKLVTAPV